jgi:hypothetical protein
MAHFPAVVSQFAMLRSIRAAARLSIQSRQRMVDQTAIALASEREAFAA